MERAGASDHAVSLAKAHSFTGHRLATGPGECQRALGNVVVPGRGSGAGTSSRPHFAQSLQCQLQTKPMLAPGSAMRIEQPLPTSILHAVAANGSTARTATANMRTERFFMISPLITVILMTTNRA